MTKKLAPVSDPDKPAELHVLVELADTTWRITVPVVIFAGLGLWADKTYGRQPWLTLLGMLIGFVFAALLIKRQLLRVTKRAAK